MQIDLERILRITNIIPESVGTVKQELLQAIYNIIAIDYIETLSEDPSEIHPAIKESMLYIRTSSKNVLFKYESRYKTLVELVFKCFFNKRNNTFTKIDISNLISALYTLVNNEDKYLLGFLRPNFLNPYLLTVIYEPYKGVAKLPSIVWSNYPDLIYFKPINFNNDIATSVSSSVPIRSMRDLSLFQRLFLSMSVGMSSFTTIIENLSQYHIVRRDMVLSTAGIAAKIVRAHASILLHRHYTGNDHNNNIFRLLSLSTGADKKMILLKNLVEKFFSHIFSNLEIDSLRKSDYFLLFAKYMGIEERAIRYALGQKDIANRRAFIENHMFPLMQVQSSALEAIDEDTDEEGAEDPEEDDIDDEPTEGDEDLDEDDEEGEEDDDTEEEETEDDNNIDEEEETEALTSKLDKLFLSSLTIEMAGDEETLEDLLYKRSIWSLVNSYYENPPEDITSEELLLLRYWCNNWIYFVSVNTTKELLSTIIGE